MDESEFDELLDASSLGSPRVEAARERIPPAAREALRRAVVRRGSVHPIVQLPPGEWSVEEVGEALASSPELRRLSARGADVEGDGSDA